MRTKTIFALAGLLLMSSVLFFGTNDTASAKSPQLVSAFGKANIGGQELIVHTVSIVPRGGNPNDVAIESLAAQGARPITSAEFSLTGLVWDTVGGVASPVFNYNGSGDPLNTLSSNEISEALLAWNEVPTDKLVLAAPGTTTVCPSLVRECPGKQAADGKNDIGWIAIKGKSTLGVTWYNVATKEADIAFDIDQNWYIDEDGVAGGSFDIRTVALHEFGHALGLSHSEEPDSVMNAYYGGVEWLPLNDDNSGILAIYDPGNAPPPPVQDEVTSMSVDVNYSLSGRRGRDLIIEVAVDDTNGDDVAGASVSISVYHNGTLFGTGGPTATGSEGTARWRVRNAASGEWRTVVTSVVKDDLTWTNSDYEETFTK